MCRGRGGIPTDAQANASQPNARATSVPKTVHTLFFFPLSKQCTVKGEDTDRGYVYGSCVVLIPFVLVSFVWNFFINIRWPMVTWP
jgi:hypothetical protein